MVGRGGPGRSPRPPAREGAGPPRREPARVRPGVHPTPVPPGGGRGPMTPLRRSPWRPPPRSGGRSWSDGITRRQLLRGVVAAAAWTAVRPMAAVAGSVGYGPMGDPDAAGWRTAPGFTVRPVAVAGERPGPGAYAWHRLPDGGATFPTGDGGWIYVSNSEVADGAGGAGALRFDASGRVVDAYPVCAGTSRNCAGGPTPWGTWLSCEEISSGRVWECDPTGRADPVVREALGVFMHEAAAVDPGTGVVYLTEDTHDSQLYRFVPDRPGDLASGRLEVAVPGPEPGTVDWVGITTDAPRVPGSLRFARGEGAWWAGDRLVFTTTADSRVWAYHLAGRRLVVEHDGRAGGPLRHPDNITVSAAGEVVVVEDGDDLQVLVVDGAVATPVAQLVAGGPTELAGVAFSPRGDRMYVSSQRWPGDGVTYEITGPFHRPRDTGSATSVIPSSAPGTPAVDPETPTSGAPPAGGGDPGGPPAGGDGSSAGPSGPTPGDLAAGSGPPGTDAVWWAAAGAAVAAAAGGVLWARGRGASGPWAGG